MININDQDNIDTRKFVIEKFISRHESAANENGRFYQGIIKILMLLHGGAIIGIGTMFGNIIGRAKICSAKIFFYHGGVMGGITLYTIGLTLAAISIIITQVYIDEIVDTISGDIAYCTNRHSSHRYLDILSDRFCLEKRKREIKSLKLLSILYNLTIIGNFCSIILYTIASFMVMNNIRYIFQHIC
jgi:hypothetical protein